MAESTPIEQTARVPGGRGYQLKDLLSYRDMIRELAITDFKLKYQGSILGYAWSLAKPLMLFAVLYVVFTRFVRLGGNVPHYAVQLLLGVVLWTYFADATSVAIGSIADRGDLIRKVYFPRIAIPVASSVSAILTFVLNLCVVVVFLVASRIGLRPEALLVLLVVLELYVLALGCSLLLAALYVHFRDFRHIWELGLQLLFYATPIIYPVTLVPSQWRWLIALNPIAQIVQDARRVLIDPGAATAGSLLPWPASLVPYLLPFVVLLAGYWYFESAAASFAEEV